jgi:hypothetical protein
LTKIYIKAYVKADVGFEKRTLSLGDILADHKTTEDVYIDVHGFVGVQVDTVITSAPWVTARVVSNADSVKKNQRIKLEVNIGPDLKPGLFSETVRVKYTDLNRPESKLYIYGIAVKDIEVNPLALTYIVLDSAISEKPQTRVLRVISHQPDTDVKILKVGDPGGLLSYDIKEVDPGQKYKITVTLDETKLAPGPNVSSSVIIATNQPDQAEIKIPFRIERR